MYLYLVVTYSCDIEQLGATNELNPKTGGTVTIGPPHLNELIKELEATNKLS